MSDASNNPDVKPDVQDDLQSRLTADMKTAMKAGDKDRLAVIRMLLNDVKNADMTRQSPLQAVEAYGKKLRKSVEEYRKYDDADRVAALEAEYAVVENYLPQKADEAETRKLAAAFIESSAFTQPGDFGKAMGGFLKAHGSEVDPGIASKVLREELNQRTS